MPRASAIITAAAILLAALAAEGAVPSLISYQGRLLDANGVPMTEPVSVRFRLIFGGEASGYPSSGTRVYGEIATISPGADGVFSHMIGSGTPEGGCAEGACTLTASDFGDDATPVWIELVLDPDGTLGTGDDDVLLPRTRLASVPYAFQAETIDGTHGGTVLGDLNATGTVSAGTLASIGDISLTTGHSILWPTRYTRCTSFNGVGAPCASYQGQVDAVMALGVGGMLSPVPGVSRDGVDGQRNNILVWGYNVDPSTGGRVNWTESKFVQQIESSFYDGTQQLIEYNWDYQNAAGIQWRPLYFRLLTAPAAGPLVQDTSELQIKMCATCQNLNLSSHGNVSVGGFGFGWDSVRLSVLHEVSGVGSTTDDRYGIYSSLRWRPAGTTTAEVLSGTTSEAVWEASGASASSVGFLVGGQGIAEIRGDQPTARTVTGHAAGLEARCAIRSGVTGGGSAKCYGLRAEASGPAEGTFSVPVLAGVLVASPGTTGANVTISRGAGILINDQRGYGSVSQGSLVIDPQTGGNGTGSKGNLLMAGGGFDDGHLSLGGGHIWFDPAGRRFRVKSQAPTAQADGTPLVTGTGSDSHGLLKWGDGRDPTFDTGLEVCAASGLTCVRTMSTSGEAANCSDSHPGEFFYALCK